MPNENDRTYLDYSDLLLQALEAGLGYRVEWENALYLAPTPLVKIDAASRFHSEDGPAIRWKGAEEFFYLHGVNLSRELHTNIIAGKMSFAGVMQLENMEQRMIACKYLNADELLKGAGARLVDKSPTKNELWLLDNRDVLPRPELFLKYPCPSTDRVYLKCVEREWALLPDGNLSADKAQAATHHFTLEEYMQLNVQS